MDTPPRSGRPAQVPRPSLPQKPRGISKVFLIRTIRFFLIFSAALLFFVNETNAAEINFPQDFTATTVSSVHINLPWEYGGADQNDGIRLYRSVAGGGTSLVAELGAESRTYFDTGLTPDTLYTYGLSAFREPDEEWRLIVWRLPKGPKTTDTATVSQGSVRIRLISCR